MVQTSFTTLDQPLDCAASGHTMVLGDDRAALEPILAQIDQTCTISFAGKTAIVPACKLENLGDPAFCNDHGIKYVYASGAMANGRRRGTSARAESDGGPDRIR